MNESPLISVIVPVYKVEQYLDRCVQSIVDQTYNNLEIILVDDGSPDSCPAMCDAWAEKDSRVRVIHKENGGVASARNTGIENACGEYICFVDSDDWIDPPMIAELVSSAIKYDTDIAGVLCRFVYANGNTVEVNLENENPQYFFSTDCMKTYFEMDVICCWSTMKLYRKRLLDDNKIRFADLLISEDALFGFYAMRSAKSFVLNTKAHDYNYQQHPESVTHITTNNGINWADNVRCGVVILRKTEGMNVYPLAASSLAQKILSSVLHLVKDNYSTSQAMTYIEDVVKENRDVLSQVTLNGLQKHLWRFYFRFPHLYCKTLSAYYFLRDKLRLRINIG